MGLWIAALVGTVGAVACVAVGIFTRVFGARFAPLQDGIVAALSDRAAGAQREARLQEMVLELHQRLVESSRASQPGVAPAVPQGFRVATPTEVQRLMQVPTPGPRTPLSMEQVEDFTFYPGGSESPRPAATPSTLRMVREQSPFGQAAIEKAAAETKTRLERAEKEARENAAR